LGLTPEGRNVMQGRTQTFKVARPIPRPALPVLSDEDEDLSEDDDLDLYLLRRRFMSQRWRR